MADDSMQSRADLERDVEEKAAVLAAAQAAEEEHMALRHSPSERGVYSTRRGELEQAKHRAFRSHVEASFRLEGVPPNEDGVAIYDQETEHLLKKRVAWWVGQRDAWADLERRAVGVAESGKEGTPARQACEADILERAHRLKAEREDLEEQEAQFNNKWGFAHWYFSEDMMEQHHKRADEAVEQARRDKGLTTEDDQMWVPRGIG